MSRAADLAELACRIQRANPAILPHAVVACASRLTRLARSYQHLAETACNRKLTAREWCRQGNIEEDIRRELLGLSIGVTFTGDPRGYVVKLQFPGGASNTLGDDGWGIA